jgi:hypothetical protein
MCKKNVAMISERSEFVFQPLIVSRECCNYRDSKISAKVLYG